ncbi:MAG: hypothetical protein IRY97_03345 [Thermomicrobiaceae bacterium]|nr:hypothetical protein [Thermomicrobiaceae bacterium]
MTFSWRLGLPIVVLLALFGTPMLAAAASPTGIEIAPQFQQFYDASGGLPVIGYPISAPVIENGLTVQYFERQRLEYHPENAGTPYQTLLGRVGADEAGARDLLGTGPFRPISARTDASCEYVAQTGHRLCNGFRAFWHSHGLNLGDRGISYRESLALFGYPISEEFRDPQTGLVTQYFERARFEYHPNNPDPYKVLLGLLGHTAWAEAAPHAVYASLSLAEQLAQRLNDARIQNGLAPLTLDARLTQIAQARSDDMASRNYFSHYSPEGQTFFDLLNQAGIPWSYAGETIQRNNYPLDETAAEAARSLLASAPHRAIILDGRFTSFGVAERMAADGIHYYTVVFVQP